MNIEGKVVEVENKNDRINLIIQTSEGFANAELPVEIKSDIELIPYQLVLSGTDVNYVINKNSNEKIPFRSYKLTIQSGPLKGREYKYNM